MAAYAIQFRRGNTTQHNSFTGLLGEVTVDTDKKTLVVHDGSTTGGFPLAREGAASNASTGSFTSNVTVGGTLAVTSTASFSDDVTITGDLGMTGHIIPSANITYDLGSMTHMWRDVYVGPGSLYVNGKKVIEDNAGTINITTDINQNLKIETTGTGTLQLSSAAGISVNGEVNALTGDLQFGDHLDMNSNRIKEVSAPVEGADAANKTYVDGAISSSLSSGTLSFDGTTGNFSGDVEIDGSLTVAGTVTTVNSETIELADNILLLNSNALGNASQSGGIEVERGDDLNVQLLWDETNDRWSVGAEDFKAANFIGDLTGDVTGTVSSISNHDTDDLAESGTNRYFTPAREAAVNAYTDQAEVDATTAAGTYTDARETAITTAYQSYADQAEVDAIASASADATSKANAAQSAAEATASADATSKANAAQSAAGTYTDARETAITSAYQSYADQAEVDAIASAEAYTDARETAITTAYQSYADQAEADAEATASADATAKANAAQAAAEATAEAYTDTRETAITSAYTSAISTAVAGKDNTDEITEGTTNLFHTTARARAAISASGSLSYNSTTGEMSFTMPAQNTTAITEGDNLYYTDARADARVANATGVNLDISNQDTDELSEGSANLYFTDARALAAAKAGMSMTHSGVYVVTTADDTGNTGSAHAITAATLGFNVAGKEFYQVFLNRQLLRPTEYTVNSSNGTITFSADVIATDDEIEAVIYG